MFPWKTHRGKATQPPCLSYIQAGLKITGNIEASSEIRIDGHISGNIHLAPGSCATITIGPRGRIEGCLSGMDMFISGTVIGSVVSTGCLQLNEGARILGDISYTLLAISPGAIVEGKLITSGLENATAALPALSLTEAAVL